jgi:hypothetical protein
MQYRFSVRWFFDHSIVSKIDSKDFNFFIMAAFIIFGESTKILKQTMRTPSGQYFNHGRRDIISEPQENKLRLKIFACPTGKYPSAYSPYALNYQNLALAQ